MIDNTTLDPAKLFKRAISFFMMFLPIFMVETTFAHSSDTTDLRWVSTQITSKTFKVKLQMKPRTNYKTGSFTVVFENNEDALAYRSYTSLALKTGDYKNSLYAGSDGGSIVVKYKGTESNGTTLSSTTWTDVGEILFDVTDSTQSSELSIVKSNTILHTSNNSDTDCVILGTLTQNDVALPVTWLFVKAMSYTDFINQIVWATAAEINNDRFEVERSFIPNHENFSRVASVKGRGNSMEITHYKINDTLSAVFTGETVYYRIKQIDLDGTVSYSKIVKVVEKVTEDTQIGASLSSNPLTIHLKEIPENLTNLVVLDTSGRELLAIELKEKATIINTENYPPGMYSIIVYSYYNQEKFKVIK